MNSEDTLTIADVEHTHSFHGCADEGTTGVMELYLTRPNGKLYAAPADTVAYTSRKHRRSIAKAWFQRYAKPYVLMIKPDADEEQKA